MIENFFEPNQDLGRCLVIAEVALSHDGSLGQAYAFIDAIAQTGADAVKFQTHIASAESTPQEPFRIAFSKQDTNRYDYWKRTEFTEAQWIELAKYANSKNLFFLSSPFSIEAVELLEKTNIPAWKIGSGEVLNWVLLERVLETKKPLLLSTGLSTWDEVEKTVNFVQKKDVPFALFQVTSMYPTPAEKIGLNIIQEYQKRFNCPVGLSDHSAKIYPSLAAVTLGAKFLEVHVTLSPYMYGPDVSSSLTVEKLKELVEGVRFLEKAFKNPIKKDELAEELSAMRKMFRRSIVPKTDLPAGKILSPADLVLKKPAIGLSSDLLQEVYGKRLKRALKKDEFFKLEDLENV